jgi:carbon-monoxide dehydrogenase medium subunit
MLLGKRLGNELIESAASAAAAATSPISDVRASAEYRREISRVFVRRALMSCCN